MTEPAANPVLSRRLRIARWAITWAIVVSCVTKFMPWHGWGEEAYLPAVMFVERFTPLSLTYMMLWPFLLLVTYVLLGRAEGRKVRAVATWVTCLWMGLATLANVVLLTDGLQIFRSGWQGILGLFRGDPLTPARHAIFIVGGFLFFAIPMLRPPRAALPACVALAGILLLANWLPLLAGYAHAERFTFTVSYWISLASSCIMIAGGTWEMILERRRGERRETPS